MLRAWMGIAGALAAFSLAASPGGSVVDADGEPIVGATVTLADAHGRAVSAHSGEDGSWRLTGHRLDGALTLRARMPGYADLRNELSLSGDAASSEALVLVLQPYASWEEEMASFTASAHAAAIDWDDAEVEASFVSQCIYCHQMGNEWTRKDADTDYWRGVIRRMEGYGALVRRGDAAAFRNTLANSFGEGHTVAAQQARRSAQLAAARYEEWAFGGASNYVHDLEVGSDGLLYGVDMGTDVIWIVDPLSGAIEQIPFPESDMPLGGMFSGGVAPLGTFGATYGPHSIIEGPDGRMYMTCSLSGLICIYDPLSGEFEFVPVGGDGIYPHTLRFDAQGTLWFTLALSNQIGRMDVATKKITRIQLPRNGFWRWMTDAFLPTILRVSSWFGKRDLYLYLSHHKISGQGHRVFNLPYGIDVDPRDGSIWYTKLYASYIGRVDPETLEVEEYKTPHDGPRRARFSPDGTLWIPFFDHGVLMAFDTQSREAIAEYPLPTLGDKEFETPYALNVHPDTHEVWITGNMSDRMLRFLPDQERFISYPSPTRTFFAREVVFTDDGVICTSNSNLPAAAIEGGRPHLLCIEPDAFGDASQPPAHAHLRFSAWPDNSLKRSNIDATYIAPFVESGEFHGGGR